MEIAVIVWLVLLVLFLIVEAATVSMVSTWFAGGALLALIVCFLGGPVWLQVLVFFTVSIVLLALLRPLVRKYFAHMMAGYVRTAELNDLDSYIVPCSLDDNQGIMGCLQLAVRAIDL